MLLLAFALSQAAAVECPMGPAAHQRAPVHHAMAHADGHGHADSPHTPAHQHGEPGHAPAACALVMACGTAAVATAEVFVPHPALSAAPLSNRAAQLYASPFIAIDAPPPRPFAAA